MCVSLVLKKLFKKNLGLKGVIEKCVVCFVVYPFFGGFLIKKGVLKWVVCGSFKSALLPLKILLLRWKDIIENLRYHIKM